MCLSPSRGEILATGKRDADVCLDFAVRKANGPLADSLLSGEAVCFNCRVNSGPAFAGKFDHLRQPKYSVLVHKSYVLLIVTKCIEMNARRQDTLAVESQQVVDIEC